MTSRGDEAYNDLGYLPAWPGGMPEGVTVRKRQIKHDFRGDFIVWQLDSLRKLTKEECRRAATAIIMQSPGNRHYTQFWVQIFPPLPDHIASALYCIHIGAPDAHPRGPYARYRIQSELYSPDSWDLSYFLNRRPDERPAPAEEEEF